MELFVVNRYVGEENVPRQTSDESELKKILIEKVRHRRKLVKHEKTKENNVSSLTSENNTLVNDVCMQNDSFENNKRAGDEHSEKDVSSKKKRKSKIENTENLDSEIHSNSTDKPKAKKKKKIAEFQSEELDNFESSNLVNGSVDHSGARTEAFSVLGSDAFSKPTKIKRSIPQWLANPSVVSVDLKKLDTPIDSKVGLDKKFIEQLANNKITHFFPVQSQVIPWLLDNIGKPNCYWPSDICVSAPTGSGKTLAFVLPILQALQNRITPQIRAIVVLPVQDLALQVYKVFESYCKATTLKVILLSKQRPFAEEQNLICGNDELNGCTTLVDIIITTPGRLVDHLMNTHGLNLKHVKYLVIDEADRVMEDMQNDWLYHLNKKILSDSSKSYQTPLLTLNTLSARRKLPQKLLFSATLSQDPEKLQQLGLFQPKLFTSIVAATDHGDKTSAGRFIGKYTTPAELEEYYTLCSKAMKPLVVHHLLVTKSWSSVLCFVNSTHVTKRLSFLLKKMNDKVKVKSISAKLSLAQRDKLIEDFAKGQIDVLISSDALARGIDIPHVKHVISYNRPKYLKTYIHRIGRTARAGNHGVSLILLTEKEEKHFAEMIDAAGKKSVKNLTVEEEVLEQYDENYQMALEKLASRLEKAKLKTRSGFKSRKVKNKCFKSKNKIVHSNLTKSNSKRPRKKTQDDRVSTHGKQGIEYG